jgi:hypothetical protein
LRELVELLATAYELPRITVFEKLLTDLRSGLFDESAPPGDNKASPGHESLGSSDPLDEWLDGKFDRPRRPTGWIFHTTDIDGNPSDEELGSDFRDSRDLLSELRPKGIEHGGYQNISIERKALVRYFQTQTVWPRPDFLIGDQSSATGRAGVRPNLNFSYATSLAR